MSNELQIPTLLMLMLLMGALIAIAIRGARKTDSVSDYAIGNLQFSPVAVGLALAASMTSAATFIINPGLIALYGFSGVISYAVVLPVAAFISLIFLTRRFREHGTKVKALTMAQWMGNRYNNKKLSLLFAVLSVLLISFIVLIVVGLAQLLSKPLNADPIWVMLGIVVFVFGYMMFGGANALIYTNTVQASLMFVVAILLLWSGREYFNTGWDGFTAQLGAIDPQLTKFTYPSSLLFRDYFEIIFCQIVIGIAVVCQPHILTKSLILKKSGDVNKFLLTSILVMTVFFAVVITGLYARISFPEFMLDGVAIKPDQIISMYIIEKFNTAALLLITLGLIAAGISTLEGLIQSLSVTFTQDLLLDHIPALDSLTNSQKIVLNRIVIIFMAVLTVVFSFRQIVAPDLSVAIFAQNGVYAFFGAAFFPLVSGMFTQFSSSKLMFITSATSLIVHFGTYYGKIGPYLQNDINNPAISATYAICCSSLIGMAGIIFMKKGTSKELSKSIPS
ncbi:MAG TPA: sodium:solute symporter [Flavobacteriales bacterium]|jgi:sodium/pantothenate symporter|nr:sodium:solute symporter [Flavobacteriales bacterium]